MLKTIILIGGPSKGTRFRPLSLDIPKPLFPVAGYPMIYHHIEAASKLDNMKEIILIGSFQPCDSLSQFCLDTQHALNIHIRYLQEFTALGTAGGMYHFRDQILSGGPSELFVMNCDASGEFPLQQLLQFHRSKPAPAFTILGTEATREQSLSYGCIAKNDNDEVTHYVEKPETFISTTISCGVYCFSPEIFTHIGNAFQRPQNFQYSVDMDIASQGHVQLEKDIFSERLAGSGHLYVYTSNNFWSQIKSAGAAIYANGRYMNIYKRTNPDRLASNHGDGSATIVGEVIIHNSANVHPTAKLGPNVTIGKHVKVGAGVRISNSMLLEGAVVNDHCCILHTVVGWNARIGKWTRVEGTPSDLNANKAFAKVAVQDLFDSEGCLNPAITVIGSNVTVPSEVIILNSIVLPHKSLTHSCKNQIVL